MLTVPEALELFYSYAREDEALRKKLETHLTTLRREGLINQWHDRDIIAGSPWAEEIDAHLKKARIILLLVSPDFIASDYCYSVEMQEAIKRQVTGETRVIPIILRPCVWKNTLFGKLQALLKQPTHEPHHLHRPTVISSTAQYPAFHISWRAEWSLDGCNAKLTIQSLLCSSNTHHSL